LAIERYEITAAQALRKRRQDLWVGYHGDLGTSGLQVPDQCLSIGQPEQRIAQ
jgi:hypothetical protein